MGNGSKSQRPKKVAQAKSALPSGVQPQQGDGMGAGAGGAGGGGEVDQEQELIFDLIKLSPIVYSSAEVGNSVEVKKQNGEFEVLLSSKRLGTVPSDYEEFLTSRPSYRGQIKRLNRTPLAATVRVRL